MDVSPDDWLPDSFSRSPGWRWGRASWLCERGERIDRRLDDAWTARARDFLAAGGPGKGQGRRGNPGPEDRAIQAALDLAREEPPHRRWAVEALLLTDEPLGAVARKSATPVEAVEAYAKLFWDVRPYLASRDWLMAGAVGTCAGNGFAGLPLGSLWKYAALTGGPRLLEVVIAVTTTQPLPPWLRASFADAEHPASEETRLRLKAKLAVAALTADSPGDMKALVEVRSRLRQLDRQMVGAPDERPGLLPVMEDFLRSVGGRRKPHAGAAAERPRTGGRKSGPRGRRKARPGVIVASLLAAMK